MAFEARRVLAVMAVTTALCADQAAMAAPQSRPEPSQITSIAQRLVTRLARNLQRVVPSSLRLRVRGQSMLDAAPFVALAPTPAAGLHRPVSPFQFRLPPPSL